MKHKSINWSCRISPDDRSQFTFEQYCSIHITSNIEMDELNVGRDGFPQVRNFLDGIKHPSMQGLKFLIMDTNDKTKADLQAAVIKMKDLWNQSKPAASNMNRSRDERTIGNTNICNHHGGEGVGQQRPTQQQGREIPTQSCWQGTRSLCQDDRLTKLRSRTKFRLYPTRGSEFPDSPTMSVLVTGPRCITSSWYHNFNSTPKWTYSGGRHHKYRNGIHG